MSEDTEDIESKNMKALDSSSNSNQNMDSEQKSVPKKKNKVRKHSEVFERTSLYRIISYSLNSTKINPYYFDTEKEDEKASQEEANFIIW